MPSFRFHLRTLLVAMLLLAVAISFGNAIVSRNKAEIRTLSAKDLALVFPEPTVDDRDGRFRVTFRSRHATVAEVAKRVGLNQLIASSQIHERHEITFESYERDALEELIDLWPTGDVPSGANHRSISGRTVDQDGRPVAEALVSLQLQSQSIIECATRRDGSFTVCFEPLNGADKYALQITFGDGHDVMTTAPISFVGTTNERLVQVRVRR